MAFKYLDKLSESWTVDHFKFLEIRVNDGNKFVFDYSTNEKFFGTEIHNVLKVSSELMSMINTIFPIIDEYDIMDWFNQKYNRDADMVDVDYEDYDF